MKESTSEDSQSSLSSSFSEYEIEVADIILNLPSLIAESESRNRQRFTWGTTRKRSVIDSGTASGTSPSRIRSSPSPSLQRTSLVQNELERGPEVKVESTSPVTPLSFSPSESDEKSKKAPRKNSKKRSREEWLEIIDGLTQRRELLKGEVETVRNYYNKLKATNVELKAKKQELSSCLKKETPHLEINKRLNFGRELGQPSSSYRVEYENQPYQIPTVILQRPYITDQKAFASQKSESGLDWVKLQIAPLLTPNSGLHWSDHAGPPGIPDLNVSAEETMGIRSSQPLDLNRVLADIRAKAAEARRSRMIKNKFKGTKTTSFDAARPPQCR
ncbi:unnamed protein product [Ilex paraguariensis]|uniref:Uncharacterized protein n=1 Tax=Ilex paraguariensis TaxID=185542 RepID=A0ABC8U9H2_9AQUA